MPDESCRNCGGNLAKCTLCAECRGAISMICTNCGVRTLEQFHGDCFYFIEKIQTNTSTRSGIESINQMVAVA